MATILQLRDQVGRRLRTAPERTKCLRDYFLEIAVMKGDRLSLSSSSLHCSLIRAHLTRPMGEGTGAAFEEGGAPTAGSVRVVLRWNRGLD